MAAEAAPSSNDQAPKVDAKAAEADATHNKAGQQESAAAPSSSADGKQATPPAGKATFVHTKQHVEDRQNAEALAARFAHTKQNIAAISGTANAPGARFTLTRQEAALAASEGGETAAPLADADVDGASTKESDDGPASGETAAAKNGGTADKPADKAKAAGEVPAAADDPQEARSPRPMLTGVPPAAEPPSKVPVDSSKTFVGPNGTYYDEAWRWMDWRGQIRSWNWPAALTFGHWFAYRRLYWHACAYLAWIGVLVAALVNGIHVALVVGAALLVAVLTGQYANTLYLRMFRRAVTHVTENGEGDYAALTAQLAAAGGVSVKAPWVMAGAVGTVSTAALAVTYWWRDGFSINVWPF